MKKILSLAMALMMLCLAAVPALAADEAKLPDNCDTTHYVLPTEKAPTIDGNITAEEWGDAEFLINAEITKGARTYCQDYYAGAGILVPDIKYQWSYDKDNFYLAISMTLPANYVSEAAKLHVKNLAEDVKLERLEINLGKSGSVLLPFTDGKLSALPDGIKGALVVNGLQRDFEFAISRSLIGTEEELQGYFEHYIGFYYYKNDTNEKSASTSEVRTRSADAYGAKKTHSLFVLAESADAAEDAEKAAEDAEKAAIAKLYTTATLKKAPSTPAIDGKISDGEYGAPIVTVAGDTKATHTANGNDKGPDTTFYVTWDETNLYIAFEADFTKFGPGESMGATNGSDMYVMFKDGSGIDAGMKAWQDLDFIHFANFYEDGGALKANNWYSYAPELKGLTVGGQSTPAESIAARGAGKSAYTLTGEGAERKLVWEVSYEWAKITKDGKAAAAGDMFTLNVRVADLEEVVRLAPNVKDTTGEGYYIFTLSNEVNGAASADTTPADTTPADTTPADTTKPADTDAPATFDAFVIVAVVAAASAAGVVVAKKRK